MTACATALHEFRKVLFQHVANPDKTDLESVERSFKVWETETMKSEHRCQLQINHYLEVHHADRLTYETNYAEYRQTLQFARQATEEATLGERDRKQKAYLQTCIKPSLLLKRPSSIYTTMLYEPPKLATLESKTDEKASD